MCLCMCRPKVSLRNCSLEGIYLVFIFVFIKVPHWDLGLANLTRPACKRAPGSTYLHLPISGRQACTTMLSLLAKAAFQACSSLNEISLISQAFVTLFGGRWGDMALLEVVSHWGKALMFKSLLQPHFLSLLSLTGVRCELQSPCRLLLYLHTIAVTNAFPWNRKPQRSLFVVVVLCCFL